MILVVRYRWQPAWHELNEKRVPQMIYCMLNCFVKHRRLRCFQNMHNMLHYTTLHYTTLHYTTLHYTTLHYTTLHYTTLHYTTLHYTTLHYTTLHYTTLHYTIQRHATPRHATPRHATPRHATPRHATPRHATPRHATPRHATPRHATPRHATPRHAKDIGVRRFDERMTMACDLLSFITCPLSERHVFVSCTQVSIHSRACVWSVGGSGVVIWWMLCFYII